MLTLTVSGGVGPSYVELIKSGEKHRIRGEFGAAVESFRAAAEIAKHGNDVTGQARALIGAGNVLYIDARYLEAIRHFREAESLARSANDETTEALSWAFLGQLYWRIGNREAGEIFLNDALNVFEKSGDKLWLALTLRFLGRLENGRTRNGESNPANDEAMRLYARSIAICQEIRNEECELTALKDLGQAWQTDRHLPEYYSKARSFLDDAHKRLKNSEYLWLYAVVLNNLATNARLREHTAEAHLFTDKAIRLFRQTNDRQELREMLDIKAKLILADKQNIERAEPIINESQRLSIELYKQFYGDGATRQQYFESIVHSFYVRKTYHTHRGNPESVLESLEAFRSWELLDSLQERQIENHMTPEEKTKDRKMLADITTKGLKVGMKNPEIIRKGLLYDEWRAEIEAKYKAPTNRKFLSNELTVMDMCRTLSDDHSAILRFDNVKYSEIRLFILTKAEVEVKLQGMSRTQLKKIELDDGSMCSLITYNILERNTSEEVNEAAVLHKHILDFEKQLWSMSPSFKSNARLLYERLLSKADRILRNVNHYKIVNVGNLSRVPFHALIGQDGRFVIESKTISYVPSVGVLAEMQSRQKTVAQTSRPDSFLGIGDAALGSDNFPKLPDTKTELVNAARPYKQSRILTGPDATLDQWRSHAANYRSIHFATHGSSDASRPMYSYLALTPSDKNSGILTAGEISRMRLNAELVVLSACETAYGKEIDNEGIIGLTWAFAAAGVPTIVATSWRVDSKTTMQMMTDFYERSNRGSRPANALREASLKRINDKTTYHPFYWAGFSVTGVW